VQRFLGERARVRRGRRTQGLGQQREELGRQAPRVGLVPGEQREGLDVEDEAFGRPAWNVASTSTVGKTVA
jgi:hypothetical protein